MSLMDVLYKQAMVGAMEFPDEIKSLLRDSGNLDGHAPCLMDMIQ